MAYKITILFDFGTGMRLQDATVKYQGVFKPAAHHLFLNSFVTVILNTKQFTLSLNAAIVGNSQLTEIN